MDKLKKLNIKKHNSTVFRLYKYLLKQKIKFIFLIISVFISTIFNVTVPVVLGKLIDRISCLYNAAKENNTKFIMSLDLFKDLFLVLLILYILISLFKFFEQYIMANTSQKLALNLRQDVIDKLNKLPLRYYDSNQKGELLSSVTNDIEQISNSLHESLLSLITDSTIVIFTVAAMFIINYKLAFIALIGLLICSFINHKFVYIIERAFAKNQRILSKLSANVEESLAGMLEIKSFNAEKEILDKFSAINNSLAETNQKSQFYSFSVIPIVRFLSRVSFLSVAVIAGILIVKGYLTVGIILIFSEYLSIVFDPMIQIAYLVNLLQAAVASAERVFKILDEQEETKDPIKPKTIENVKGNVKFSNVKFGYTNSHLLMENINIDVKAKEKIAIVGHTGSGKTTLINLLMRFYDPKGGTISIDNVNTKDMTRNYLRSLFGMVLQDTWLFNGTIYENIIYGNENASMEDVIKASKAASADKFIDLLPDKYETIINESSSNLSYGQKQLITIARVILSNPKILILDEATSNIDTKTEKDIQKSMDYLMSDRTSFVIAHRLSTIKNSDKILVMRNGTIVEQGNHKELIKLNNIYADLYNSQFTE